jgi:arylsulfatase A-like enzyme
MTNQPDNTPATRPNIILILADDMGFSDIGCYGSEIRTPNLDAMAEKGLRFSQMYNSARCCPTRACLLTGLHPHQAGLGHMVENVGVPDYQGYLRDDCVTIAEALRTGGYQTMMTGKWHVGGLYDPMDPSSWKSGDPQHPTPRQRGFDRFYGTLDGVASYFHPHTLLEDDQVIKPEGDEFYYTDAISSRSVEMIAAASKEDSPFFLFVSYTAPHWPLHAPQEDIARYQGRYLKGGWDALRTQRHEELKAAKILDEKWAISPRDEQSPTWQDAEHKEWEDLRMAVYAAQIDRMDQGIGDIRRKLDEEGIADNTIILFLSDNGGCAELFQEDGFIQRYSTQTPDGKPIRTGNYPSADPGGPDTLMSYDLPWANASNAPFRLYKHWIHEGGISTPMIVHWPASIPGSRIEHTPCYVIDIMPTLLEIAGVEYPKEYNDHTITPMEGESLKDAFLKPGWTRDRPIFWEHEGHGAVRMGDWKLVRNFPGQWELYDMNADRTELHNLRTKNLPQSDLMEALYWEWAQRCKILDWPDLGARDHSGHFGSEGIKKI